MDSGWNWTPTMGYSRWRNAITSPSLVSAVTSSAGGSVSRALIERLGPRIPTLGVCLGHQCIAAVYGGRVIRAPEPVHGKVAEIHHRGDGIFAGLPQPFSATRYHSLIVERETLPPALEVTAETSDGLVMALRHREYPIVGVQFHPESILTTAGKDLLRNFLRMSPVSSVPTRPREFQESLSR